MRAAFLAALIAAPAPALAEEPGLGARTYLDACAGCHGEAGRGDGPIGDILTVAVPDLTGLLAANGGVFPWLRVVYTIDGRSGLRGHGGPMPIFGVLFTGDTAVADAPDGSPVIVSARVLALVDYLQSLQEVPR